MKKIGSKTRLSNQRLARPPSVSSNRWARPEWGSTFEGAAQDPRMKDRYFRELRRELMLCKGELVEEEQESSDDSEQEPVLIVEPQLQMHRRRAPRGGST
ncbi:hypothetical protein AMTR_s00072p00126480 [Amborella trichopoda]|uniref:Uncharacterized protein n=1 Tax=Amborella trichopoda TaxID=13333 RepID=W1NUU6_AMBTC|nr:hypothetical protein AMTR_s00072p00126480 [Amborella trichopoda]